MPVPTGYTYAQTLTVTNNAASTITGSTTTPVATSSTDYAVQVHLTGAAAAQVYNNSNLSGATGFSDVAVFFSGTQIDVHIDQGTNGAWSPSNVTLWFKLQASIAAIGTDTNYQLAYGKTSGATLTTKNSKVNIYPFFDDFDGVTGGSATTLDSTKWTTVLGTSGSVSVASSVATLSTSGGETKLYASTATFGVNTLTFGYGIMGTVPITGTSGIELGMRNAGNTPLLRLISDNGGNSWTTYQVDSYNTALATTHGTIAQDGSYHLFSVARDGSGHVSAFVDGVSAGTVVTQSTAAALAPTLDVNQSASGAMTETFDWLGVRPWVTTEPTVAAGSVQSLPTLAVTAPAGNVIVGGTLQFTATPSSGSPTVTWSVSGGGSITSGGLFTSATAGGPYTVTAAASGYISGTASVSVITVGSYNKSFIAPYGAAFTGKATTLGYTIYDSATGSTLQARTTGSTTEIGTSGTYVIKALLAPTWSGVLVWDAPAAGVTPFSENFDPPPVAISGGIVTTR